MSFQSAYILHRYPYRETSFLLKAFTENEGMVSLVARNAKRPRSDWYGLLQPFQNLRLLYHGKGDLLNLQQVERGLGCASLQGRCLFAAFYLNELLLKFLAPHDPHPDLFVAYQQALSGLHESLEVSLRIFELRLFSELGLLPDFSADQDATTLEAEAWYILELDHLPKKVAQPMRRLPQHFQGFELLALQQQQFEHENQLATAKRFVRLWLSWYGMGRDLKTREIFAEVFGG